MKQTDVYKRKSLDTASKSDGLATESLQYSSKSLATSSTTPSGVSEEHLVTKSLQYSRTSVATSGAPSSGAYDDRLVVKLLCNYRSHPEILKIPNESFYDGELLPCADKVARTMLSSWSELPGRGFPLVFHGVVGRDEREERSPSFFNVDEIAVVMQYVAKLMDLHRPKISQEQIGIISPYRKQVLYILRAMTSHTLNANCMYVFICLSVYLFVCLCLSGLIQLVIRKHIKLAAFLKQTCYFNLSTVHSKCR